MTDPESRALVPSGNDPAPDDPGGRYTVRPGRLAGSGACLNCGTVLAGPFCHYCGQPDKRLMRFFPVLLREFLEDFVDFDSRFVRTLKPLLFKPGRLTRDFMDGKRFRYTPPLRLYLFSSVILFVVVTLVSAVSIPNLIDTGSGDRASGRGISVSVDSDSAGNGTADSDEETPPGTAEDIDFTVGGESWDRETNPLIIPFMPDRLNDWINDEIAEMPRKERELEADPKIMFDQMLDLLPGTMFVLLPVVALILKVWYLFSKHYYVEHLILSLHNHAFLFVCMMILVPLDVATESISDQPALRVSLKLLAAVLYCWIPVYLVWSLKTVYRQGWPLTLVKGVAIGIIYSVLLIAVLGFISLLSLLLV